MIPCEKWYHSAKLLCVALNDTLGELYAGGGGVYLGRKSNPLGGKYGRGFLHLWGGEPPL